MHISRTLGLAVESRTLVPVLTRQEMTRSDLVFSHTEHHDLREADRFFGWVLFLTQVVRGGCPDSSWFCSETRQASIPKSVFGQDGYAHSERTS